MYGTCCGSEILNGGNKSEDLGVDGEIMDIMEIGWDGVDWIHLAQVREQWRDLVNTVMDLRDP